MAEIFQLEQKLEASLIRLKEDFGLYAVKGEFEAEGASFRAIARLRRLTARHNISLYLKIGGRVLKKNPRLPQVSRKYFFSWILFFKKYRGFDTTSLGESIILIK